MLALLIHRNRLAVLPFHNAICAIQRTTTTSDGLISRFWQHGPLLSRTLTTESSSFDVRSSSSSSVIINKSLESNVRTLADGWTVHYQVPYSEQKKQREFKKFQENYEKFTRRFVIRDWFNNIKNELVSSSGKSSSSPQAYDFVGGSSTYLFNCWCKQFRKTYTSVDEKQLDFKAFRKDYIMITKGYAKCTWFSQLKSITNLSYDGSHEEISQDDLDHVVVSSCSSSSSSQEIDHDVPSSSSSQISKLNSGGDSQEEFSIPCSHILIDYFEGYRKKFTSEQEKQMRFENNYILYNANPDPTYDERAAGYNSAEEGYDRTEDGRYVEKGSLDEPVDTNFRKFLLSSALCFATRQSC